VGLKLSGTHQLLIYADEVNLLNDNIDTTNKKRETLTDASKKLGLEVNTEKTEDVAQLKYLGMTVTNHSFIQKEIKRRLNSSNACYQSSPRFFCLLIYCMKT
jgi:hypothetical protein